MALIVLNYHTWADTTALVESAQRLLYPDLHVYVVDNGSSATVYSELTRALSPYSAVSVIRLNENVGFAAGINAGISAAIADGYDAVLACNSDVLFLHADTIEIMVRETQEGVGVVAPAIVTPNGRNQNPYRIQPFNEKERRYYYWLFATRSGVMWLKTKIAISRMLRSTPGALGLWRRVRSRQTADPAGVLLFDEASVDIYAPHGACFLLSPSYLDTVGLLDDGTFLYAEEYILAERCARAGLRVRYTPRATVLHLEGASSQAAWGRRQAEEQYAHWLKSRRYWAENYLVDERPRDQIKPV